MIYLDYNATTPVDPAVAEAMEPYIKSQFGNPGSAHVIGMISAEAVRTARKKIADLLNAQNGRIVFTGCATEANNLAIKGVAEALQDKGRHIITTTVEHPSVLAPIRYLEKFGWEITYLAVDADGMIQPDHLAQAIRKDTVLVSIMHANNETGTIFPIEELSGMVRQKGILFHTDAAQTIGKIEVDVQKLGVDLLTVAGHKFYAPKGVGALYIRAGTLIEPLIHGGGQEDGFRSGTENVIHIVGMGVAAMIAKERLNEDEQRIRLMRDALYDSIFGEMDVQLIGHPKLRLPNTLNLAFLDCKGERIQQGAPDVATSLGAACHDRHVTMSPVLAAMGIDPEIAKGSIRISLGRFTTDEEIAKAAAMLVDSAKQEKRRNG